jgi:hypothetical protein
MRIKTRTGTVYTVRGRSAVYTARPDLRFEAAPLWRHE